MDVSLAAKAIFDTVGEWFATHGVRVLSIAIFAYIASSLVRGALAKNKVFPILDNIPRPKYKDIIGESQKRRIQTVLKAIKGALSGIIWTIAVLTALPEFGVNVAPIIAGLGLAGLAVGMAAKDLLTDFISGVFIIIEGEYNIDDKIKVAGVVGKVKAISLRRTVLQGSGGSIHIIPNREVKVIKRFAGRKGVAA